MEKIRKNHWYVNKNRLSISLIRFHAEINVVYKDDNICAILIVTRDDRKTLSLNFDSIEDAILFTENELVNCKNFEDVLYVYGTYIRTTSMILKKK